LFAFELSELALLTAIMFSLKFQVTLSRYFSVFTGEDESLYIVLCIIVLAFTLIRFVIEVSSEYECAQSPSHLHDAVMPPFPLHAYATNELRAACTSAGM
jgi:hypothetical protein